MDNGFDLAGIAAVLLALITLFQTVYKPRSKRTSEDLDNAGKSFDMQIQAREKLQVLADSAINKQVALYDRIVCLEADVSEMKADLRLFLSLLADWYDGIQLLLAQIRDLGHVPKWEPDVEALEKLKQRYQDK